MPLVIFDTETGGLRDIHPTIQLAAIAVDADWKELDSFEVKLQFDERRCERKALEINHWTAEAWTDAVPLKVAYQRFKIFLEKHADLNLTNRFGDPYQVARLCGHNAAAFDFPRLINEFRSVDIFLPADFSVLDTLGLFRWLRHLRGGSASGRLTEIASAYGIDAGDAHDALADCRLTAAIAPKMLAELQTLLNPVKICDPSV